MTTSSKLGTRFAASVAGKTSHGRAASGAHRVIGALGVAAAIALLVPVGARSARQPPAAAGSSGQSSAQAAGQSSNQGGSDQGAAPSSGAGSGTSSRARVQPGTGETDRITPLVTQAQQALDRQDYNSAIPLLQKIEAARPEEPLPHFELGYAYSELKHNDDAVKEYRRALEIDPKLAVAQLNLGLVLLDSDPAAALDSFRRAQALLPDQGQPHYLAGRALERGGKLPEALAEYQTAVQLNPKEVPMRFALGQALLAAGRDADAEAQFREALTLPGDTSPAQLGLAGVLVHEKKLAEAADAYAAYLAANPGDHNARFELAVAQETLGRFNDALSELDRMAKDAAPGPEELKLRASIFLQMKRWPEAEGVLQKASETSPNDAEIFGWLGRALIELHNYPAAVTALRRSLSIDPAELAVIRSLAEADYLSGQYAATLLALDQVEKQDTLKPMDFFIRAICHEKLAQKAEALAAYEQFLSQDHNANPDQEWQAQQRVKVLMHDLHGG